MSRKSVVASVTILLFCLTGYRAYASLDAEIFNLQRRWAEVNYQLVGNTRVAAFEELIHSADQVVSAYPESAEGWIWRGIIKSTYAGVKGGLGALKLAKASRRDLKRAIKIEPDALNGSAYASLGTLYFKVPGWPLGFGNDEKAGELLEKAVAINPEGIDSNYFYGEYLIHEKRYAEARDYLLKAKGAPLRPNRPLADAGRLKEVTDRLAWVERQITRR